jgi:ParB family chromosome partitioning protein
MADEARSRLGRGLASLIGDVGGEAAHVDRPRNPRKVPIEFLKPNPRNPRRTFSDAELGELASSVKQHGVIQPIVVRPVKGAQDRYEIIAGERRWRAAQLAGLHEVPIVPVDVSDSDALEIAIIENVQREDLNAMEEAHGYHALADEFRRSQEDIAKIVGKSRSHVANMMRLTKLPEEVQAYIAKGDLSAGHARALIGVPDPLAAAKRIVAEGLNWASAFGDTQVLDNHQLNSWLASRLTKACVESYCLDGHCPPGQLTHAPPDSFNLMELGLSSPSRRWCVTPAFRGTPVLIIGLRCEMVG